MIGSGSSGCSSSLLHDHRRLRFEFVFEHLPFEFRGRGEGGVRISRNSPPSPGLFLRRREFRSRLKNNSAGLARAGSFPVDFTATAHLDRSIAIFRLFSLSFSLLLFLSTNQRQRWLCLFSIRSPTSLERFPRFSTNRVERIGRVISFPFLFPFFLNKHVIYV